MCRKVPSNRIMCCYSHNQRFARSVLILFLNILFHQYELILVTVCFTVIIIGQDFLSPPRRSSPVKSNFTSTVNHIHPLAHLRGTSVLSFVVEPAYYSVPLPPPPRYAVRAWHDDPDNKEPTMWSRQFHSPIESPLLPILCALSRSLHRNPSPTQGNLHTILPTYTRSSPYSCSTYFLHSQDPHSHTVLIHSLHWSKPSQHSLIHSTRLFSLYSKSSTNLFVSNSMH